MSNKNNHNSAEQDQAEEQRKLEELAKEKSAQAEKENDAAKASLARVELELAQLREQTEQEAGNEQITPKPKKYICAACKEEVHKDATRCPHCTTQLKKVRDFDNSVRKCKRCKFTKPRDEFIIKGKWYSHCSHCRSRPWWKA